MLFVAERPVLHGVRAAESVYGSVVALGELYNGTRKSPDGVACRAWVLGWTPGSPKEGRASARGTRPSPAFKPGLHRGSQRGAVDLPDVEADLLRPGPC